jgi:hypothetical protein
MRKVLGIIAAGSLVLVAAACGSSANAERKASATTTSTRAELVYPNKPLARLAHPLAVTANGDFDAAKVDLSGIYGVTPAEQHRAEALLKESIEVLPHWANVATAAKEGFHSIGDGLTGDEHWIHWDWINDNDYLDPHHPEALVYHVDPSGKRTIEAAMFILPNRFNFHNIPDWYGTLVQFHIHDNLCFTNDPVAPQVAGITSDNGPCNPPLVNFHPNVMMHVWIRPNPCGPFAALEGVGAGQTAPGTVRACDRQHGNRL